MNDMPDLDPVAKLSRDLRDASRILTTQEARFLVDAYYAMQDDRIRAGHQLRTLEEGDEPASVMGWLWEQRSVLEKQVGRALDAYSGGSPIGQWARSIVGIGPVISAGLLAHIDPKECPSVSHIWRYAGLDPTSQWLGNDKARELVDSVIEFCGNEKANALSTEAISLIAERIHIQPMHLLSQLVNRDTGKSDRSRANVIKRVAKRPWNASLKRLCFLIGESFVKVQNNENDVYGTIYALRKEEEVTNNEAGKYAEQARTSLATRNFGRDTDARMWYEGRFGAGTMHEVLKLPAAARPAFLNKHKGAPGSGVEMLPPGRIHLRAKRYAVKLFLSHFHHVMYEVTFHKPPPAPYVFDRLGHVHYMGPPNWPMPK